MTNDPTEPIPRPTTGLAWGIATHARRVRDQNDDSGHASPWLFVDADGTGGRQADKIATELTVTTITNACAPAPIGAGETPLAHPNLFDLVKSVVDANTAIFGASLDNPAQQGMGTTVTALALIVDDTDPDTPTASASSTPATPAPTSTDTDTSARSLSTTPSSKSSSTKAESPPSRQDHPRRNIATQLVATHLLATGDLIAIGTIPPEACP